MRQSLRWLVSGLLLAGLVLHAGLESKATHGGRHVCVWTPSLSPHTVDLAAIGISLGGEFGVLKGIVKNTHAACTFKSKREVRLHVAWTESGKSRSELLKYGYVTELGPGKYFHLTVGQFTPGKLREFLNKMLSEGKKIPPQVSKITLRLIIHQSIYGVDSNPANDVMEVPL